MIDKGEGRTGDFAAGFARRGSSTYLQAIAFQWFNVVARDGVEPPTPALSRQTYYGLRCGSRTTFSKLGGHDSNPSRQIFRHSNACVAPTLERFPRSCAGKKGS